MSKIYKLPLMVSVFVFINILYSNVVTALGSNIGVSDTETNENLPIKADEGYMWDIIWVLFVLIFVIFLLYMTVKFLANRNKSFMSPKGIRSLGGMGVGANSSVQVLHIADHIYIVGVGQQVTLLDKETDPEVVEQIINSFETKDQTKFVSFKDWLLKLNKKDKEEKIQQTDWNSSNSQSFESLLQSKLDKQAERKQQLESLLKDNNE